MDWTEEAWWDWTWADMGLKDALANIRLVNERNDRKKKISYLGYSQGTVQMFYALTKIEDELVAQNLNGFGALAPCTIDVNEGTQFYYDGLFHF